MKVLTMVSGLLLATAPLASAQTGTFPTMPLTHKLAPFIMTHAVAEKAGATAEWRKMEGLALDEKNHKLYLAISDIGEGMADGEGDIALEANPCGAVYVADLDADFNITSYKPLVVGGPYNESAEANPCAVDNIASPDNLAVDAQGRLWIGEDTSDHTNNMLWVYDPKTEALKRFATVPLGAEVTGLAVTPTGTVFMNVQHPDPRNVYPFNRGVIGVVTGFNASADDFSALKVPQGDAQKQAQVAVGAYQVIGRVGDPLVADTGQTSGSGLGEIMTVSNQQLAFCNNPDGNVFLSNNSAGTEGYLYTNLECQPGGVSKLYIRKDKSGQWQTLEGEQVNFASVNGTWNNCNAKVTPWGTDLSGEEYPAESADDWDGGSAMAAYLGHAANPYDYGYLIELKPQEGIGTEIAKHYAMGRISAEHGLVMPDSRTTYMGDDGTDRVLYKFVADEAENLDAGTLYAAKVAQQADGSFNLKWLELGHGVSDEVYAGIRKFDTQLEAANN